MIKKKFEIEFSLSKTNHIFIDIQVNKIQGQFIVDTGASFSCINLLSSKKFDLKLIESDEKAFSATNKIKETFYSKSNTIKIDNYFENNINFFVFDMSYINKSLKDYDLGVIDGIIGGDILIKLEAIVDYKKKRLKF